MRAALILLPQLESAVTRDIKQRRGDIVRALPKPVTFSMSSKLPFAIGLIVGP